MPEAPATEQVIAVRAAVEAPAPPIVEPPPGSDEAMIKRIQDGLKESPRRATEAMAARKAERVDSDAIRAALEANIGLDKRPDGTPDRSAEENERLGKLVRYQELAEKLIDTRFENLPRADQEDLISYARDVVANLPNIEAIFDGGPMESSAYRDLQIDAAVARLLRDRGTAGKLNEVLKELADKRLPEGNVVAARLKQRDAEEAERVKKAELDAKKKAYDDMGGGDYEPGGTKRGELDTLTGELPTIHVDRDAAQDDLEMQQQREQNLQLQLRAAEGAKKRDDAEISRLIKDIGDTQTAILGVKSKIRGFDVQIRKQQQLDSERKEAQRLQGEISVAEAAYDNAQRSRMSLQATTEAARLSRRDAEIQYVKEVGNMFAEAVERQLMEKVGKAEAKQAEILLADGDANVKKVVDGLDHRYDKTGKDGKSKGNGYDGKKVEPDYRMLLAEGPEAVVVEMLKSQGVDEAEAKRIAADPEFLAKVQDQVVERAITRRIQTGKITDPEVEMIADSKWGTGKIEKALANIKAGTADGDRLKGVKEELKKAGALDKSGKLVSEWRKKIKMPSKGLLFLLASTIGTILVKELVTFT